jgi:predicted RNA binding protein YcfA (HicA-like mRNA interferase family)
LTHWAHHIFTNQKQPGHFTVPQAKHDLGRGLVRKFLKQAGLDKEQLP